MSKDKTNKKEDKVLEKNSQDNGNEAIESSKEKIQSENAPVEESKESSFKLPKITITVSEEK